MAKNDYFVTLASLAEMAVAQTNDVSVERETQAQSLLDSMIITLSEEWMPPMDREDMALLGQGLVRLTRMVGDILCEKTGDWQMLSSCLQPLPLWMEKMADIHKIGQWLPEVMAHDRHIRAVEKQLQHRYAVCFDVLREITDAVICIILKYS